MECESALRTTPGFIINTQGFAKTNIGISKKHIYKRAKHTISLE